MNFLVDAQLPPGLCRWLQARGHEAAHVSERDGPLTDQAVAIWAETQRLILISKDDDFLTIRLPNRFAFFGCAAEMQPTGRCRNGWAHAGTGSNNC